MTLACGQTITNNNLIIERAVMDKDLTVFYGSLSAFIGAVFGVEMGVFFCAAGGAILSLRFTETKSTLYKAVEVIIGTILSCAAIAAIISVELVETTPVVKLLALFIGAGILILFDGFGKGLKQIDLGSRFNIILDRVIDKWTR
jgi:hypothetical protein